MCATKPRRRPSSDSSGRLRRCGEAGEHQRSGNETVNRYVASVGKSASTCGLLRMSTTFFRTDDLFMPRRRSSGPAPTDSFPS